MINKAYMIQVLHFIWLANPDIQILYVPVGISTTCDKLIGLDNFLDVNFNEIVERINVLLD